MSTHHNDSAPNSRQAHLVQAQDVEEKVAMRFLGRLVELAVVRQEHLQSARLVTPHLWGKVLLQAYRPKQANTAV